MARNSEDVGLTDVTIITEQNERIAQLMQQIAKMRFELQHSRKLRNLATAVNTPLPSERGPPLHFHSSNLPEDVPNNPSIISTHKSPTIDLPISNPRHVSFLYRTPPPPQGPYVNNSQTLAIVNPSTTQFVPSKATCHVPNFAESYPSTYIGPDRHEENKNKWRAKERMTGEGLKEEIMRAMKEFQYTADVPGLNYEDLCIHPDLDLPKGFKIPKFSTFDGNGNPMTHLRTYCDQLVGIGKNEALLMRLFSQSLNGEALEWFASQKLKQWLSWEALAKDFVERFGHNIEIAPDRYYLERIKRVSTENYGQYALRWRKEAARVQPPMSECEITEMFIRIQEPEYYERMLCMLGRKFIEVIKVGEALEDGFKTGKFTVRSNDKIIGTNNIKMSGRKEEEVFFVSAIPQRKYQNHHTNQRNFSHPKFRKPPKVFTPLKESQTQLYKRLKAAGMLHPIKGRPANPLGKFYRADHRCAYHSGAVGHDTENCSTLKHKIQNMLNNKLITFDEASPSGNMFHA